MPRSDRSVSFLKFTVSKSQLSPLGFSEMYTDEVLSVELSGMACHRQATEWGPVRPFQMGITPSPSEQSEGTMGSTVRALLMCLWQAISCNSSITSEVELCQRKPNTGRTPVSDRQNGAYSERMASLATA